MQPCNLNRCHEEHVELDVAIQESFAEHDPSLFEPIQVLFVEQGHYGDGSMKESTDRCIKQWRLEAHPLLEHEVRH